MLQRLGHVLANLAQRSAAAAGARGRRRMYEALARKVIRQRTACRPLAFEACDLDLCAGRSSGSDLRLSLGLRCILFQLAEPKLKLFENGAALGGLAVLLVAQLGDSELHLLDQQRPRLRLSLGGQA